MARLSLWRNGTHSNDYKFIDRIVSEQYTVGATGVILHKYLGPIEQTGSTNATIPSHATQSEKNIEDLLFLENRDRKYDTSVYIMRGHYSVSDSTFDLSQFGLFLQTGTLFMTFHINDMVAMIGRKIINGDVLELPHLIDYNSLDTSTPVALKRFYVCSDAQFAAEGFSPTWFPHSWRVKINPMTDAQEFKDILNNTMTGEPGDAGDTTPIGQILSTLNLYQGINSAVIEQAEQDVPKSGYDTQGIYIKSDKLPSETTETPTEKVKGYMVGDGLPPNAASVAAGLSFPQQPKNGDFYLRLDYVPNRLFRYDSQRWIKVEDAVRTNLTNGSNYNLTMRTGFINDSSTIQTPHGVQPTLQSLNSILRPKADNQ